MTRVAIYARYSSDKQSDASIEDQIRLCDERAKREGWQVVQRYTDHGISGASLLRPGIQALMRDAQSGIFNLVLSEALDRVSRDQEDIAGLYKRLRFAGIPMVTLSEGEIGELHIGLKGTMGALFLRDLADKTRRGLRGRVEAGRSGGGNSYGYDVVVNVSASGEADRGERTINEQQAAIVREIFNAYAAGKSPKAIALDLNKRGESGPSGKGWGPSTINGNWRRGTGILNNELYIGRLVWNRLTYMKNPDTGKRVSRLNLESAWVAIDVPELRIIDQELWDEVKARQHGLRKLPAFHQKQRPRMLLSYLLKCGSCGGGFSKISQTHYGCSTARNKGTCTNRSAIKQEELEGRILGALQSQLMEPELCKEFCDEYTRHLNQLRNEKNAHISAAKAELIKVAKARENIIEAIKNGIPASEVKEDLARVAARRDELQRMLDQADEEPVLLHPNMAGFYREQVAALAEALTSEEFRGEAADLLRSLIESIVLSPSTDGGLDIDLHGDLAGILSLATAKKGADQGPDLQQVKMVAGVGFEPTTFRL
ncbi:resolvase [Novosphingobium endophyticum]|uniref:Resolvase n=1 Tax=Novosphingobium endophyticum TaxID=1955250 RepID=A0A916X5V5_9SPHN|nr:resolvase [Novosphingobium endophyticum]